jgi:glycosyltransferase involved in cell wall biosynthesis
MQKTDFQIEVLIHDDASTDGTADIIREYEDKYPEIIKPIYQIENQYSKGIKISQTYNWPRAQGKYMAFCEGDDYWTDPYKLQKQVDFLEKNPEYGMCYTKARQYNQSKKAFYRNTMGRTDSCVFDKLLNGFNTMPTLTICLRNDLLIRYMQEIKPETKEWQMGDYPLNLWFSYNTKVHFINEVTGVYRISENSASHFSDMSKLEKFFDSVFDVKRFFLQLYNKPVFENVLNDEKYSVLAFEAAKNNEYKLYKNYINRIRGKHKYNKIKKIISEVPILLMRCRSFPLKKAGYLFMRLGLPGKCRNYIKIIVIFIMLCVKKIRK